MQFPNNKGKAIRSKVRNERYGTHLTVLGMSIDILNPSIENPIELIEHGMGLSSTSFLHSIKNVNIITSFEREIEWANCKDCDKGSQQCHNIILINDDSFTEQITSMNFATRAVALVDGYALHRPIILESLMKNGVEFIVEHDAETFVVGEVVLRQAFARKYDYDAYQYVGKNPESALYVKKSKLFQPTNEYVAL